MKIRGVRNNELTEGEDEEADFEMVGTSGLLSSHASTIPIPSAVQGPRIFYGSRQAEQALPMVDRQAAWVRNLNEGTGRSWDHTLGNYSGAIRSKGPAVVKKVTEDEMHLLNDDGTTQVVDLYNNFPFNRKSAIHSFAKVKAGDRVEPDQLLATSNFTDDEGRLALGRNLRVAVVPFKGFTMDDAVVISSGAAKGLTTDHAETLETLPDEGMKGGKHHYTNLFPKKFKPEQLDNLDDEGIVKPGTILQPGDPVTLFTRPRVFSSQNQNVSRLTRQQRFVRKDAASTWDGKDPATVTDVARARDGTVKVLVKYTSPVRPGDKLAMRAGQKFTVAKIIPDEKMLRNSKGEPMEVLFNQLGLPSRENASTFYEILLGKIAAQRGKAYTLPNFNKPGESWANIVEKELADNGVEPEERVYDPEAGKWLDNTVTTGNGYLLRLHHLAGNKLSHRGQTGYSSDRQPQTGGGRAGGAQRMSGLEMAVLHSSGARGVQKEAVMLRGEMREDYWKALRANRPLPKLGKPFVWDKFQALINGIGVNARDLGHGKLRLTPLTEKDLDARKSVEIANDGIVDLRTMEPKVGGLFDPQLVRDNKWGHITLPFPVINPAYEPTVKTLLGLTDKEYKELLHRKKEAAVA
jgi:DNA-directed RNA polymerase subunit beta